MKKKIQELLRKNESNLIGSERRELMFEVQDILEENGIKATVKIDDDSLIIEIDGKEYELPMQMEIVIDGDNLREI